MKRKPLLNKRAVMCGVFFIFFLSLSLSPVTTHAAQEQAKALWLGTNPAGTVFYILGAGIAKVVSSSSPQQIKVKSVGSPQEWLSLMNDRDVDLGIVNAAVADDAYRGQEEFKEVTGGKGFRFMRTILAGGILSNALVAAGDSGIKTIADVKGKQVTFYQIHATNNPFVRAALATGGLTEKDVKKVMVGTVPEGTRTVASRRADVTLGSIGSSVLLELQSARGGINYIPLVTTPQAVAAMKKELPTAVVDYPAALGGKVGCIGVRILLVARADMDNDTVYNLTKSVFDNLAQLGPIHANFMSWEKNKFSDPEGVSVPFHDGAIKFFKEKGLWTKDAEAFQKAMLK